MTHNVEIVNIKDVLEGITLSLSLSHPLFHPSSLASLFGLWTQHFITIVVIIMIHPSTAACFQIYFHGRASISEIEEPCRRFYPQLNGHLIQFCNHLSHLNNMCV